MVSNYDAPFEKIAELSSVKQFVLIGIDGGCGAGKTTLAGEIQKRFGGNVFHMDDFFLRPEQRTAARLTEAGGNVDHERFYDEVLLPLLGRERFEYRPYSCKTGLLESPVSVTPMNINVIEGSYSLHPHLAFAYDLSVFMQVSPALQRARILERNKSLHKRFFEEWIPMEQRYFTETAISQRCDLIITV